MVNRFVDVRFGGIPVRKIVMASAVLIRTACLSMGVGTKFATNI